jgi:hypothetical protein
MTVDEVYSQIKQLTPAERAQLRQLLDGLDEPPGTYHSQEELEQMLLDGLNSGRVVADDAYWAKKERRVIERQGPA